MMTVSGDIPPCPTRRFGSTWYCPDNSSIMIVVALSSPA